MKIEDIKEPCVECIHEAKCTIRHPELMGCVSKEEQVTSCEKLNKFSMYVDSTRPQIF